MSGRRVLITGGARGMGRAVAEALAADGDQILILDWQGEEGARVRDLLCHRHGATAAQYVYCDLSDPRQVRVVIDRLLAEGRALDVLLCNAGITYPTHRRTPEGFDYHLAICHLAHLRLIRGLLPLLERASDPRIVLVSSEAHRSCKAIDLEHPGAEPLWAGRAVSHAAGFRAYAQAKLCNLLTVQALAPRLRALSSPVTVNAVSPGYFVATGIHREMQGVFGVVSSLLFGLLRLFRLNTAAQGARCALWACRAPELKGVSGQYFSRCRAIAASPQAQDAVLANRLWHQSAEWLGLSPELIAPTAQPPRGHPTPPSGSAAPSPRD